MAERDITLYQENASGKVAQVVLSPTAAQHVIACNTSGVLVTVAAPNAIADAVVASADPVPKADYDVLVGKFNAVLAALRTIHHIKT